MNKVIDKGYDFIINSYASLVYKMFSHFNVNDFEKDDLIQAGFMGLLKASKLYDAKKGHKFSTYACFFILGEIKKELRKRNFIKLNRATENIIKIIKNNDTLSIDEIMEKYHVKREDLITALTYQDNTVFFDNLDDIPETQERVIYFKNGLEELVYTLRNVNHLTQIEIAKRLRISQSKVSRILKKLR